MQKVGTRFTFRRGIPEHLRSVIGKREIKIPVGADYKEACRLVRQHAVATDQAFTEAQSKISNRTDLLNFCNTLTPITELTEELKQSLHAYWIGVVDTSDQQRRANGFADIDDLGKFRADAEKMLARLKADWKNGNITPYTTALNNLMLVRGYRLELSATDERLLCLQFVRAAMAGYELLLARDEGQDPTINLSAQPLPAGNLSPTAIDGAVAAQYPHRKASGKDKAITLLDLFEAWNDPAEKRPQKTIDSVRQHINDFSLITHKQLAHEVTQDDFNDYIKARRAQGKAASTINKGMSFLSAVWNAACNNKLIRTNPTTGIKTPRIKRRGVRELDISDLKTLLDSPLYSENKRPTGGGGDAAVWLPLLGMFTGTRLEELAQLTLQDIRTYDGSVHLDLVEIDESESDAPEGGQRLKTESSRRKVPVHAELIKAGFLTYVEHLRQNKQTWLFPDLNPDRYGSRSGNWSKWWGRWRRENGLDGRGKRFHDFRHLFKTACRDAEIAKEVHDGLTGHTPGSEGGNYGEVSYRARVKAIGSFAYPGLKITWIWIPPATSK